MRKLASQPLTLPPEEDDEDDPEEDVMMSLEPLKAFGKRGHPVEIPPNADNRTFNVYDILGDLDRDDRG